MGGQHQRDPTPRRAGGERGIRTLQAAISVAQASDCEPQGEGGVGAEGQGRVVRRAGWLLAAHAAATAARWCLYALLVTLPVWRHRVLLHSPDEAVFYEFHDIIFYTNDLIWLGVLGAWLLSAVLGTIGGRPRRLRAGPPLLAVGLAALVLLALASLVTSVSSRYTAYALLRLAMLAGLYLAVLDLRPSPWATGAAISGGIALEAAIALPQFALGHWLGLKRLGESPFQPDWPGTAVVFLGGQRWSRAYGWTQHPNMLGGCLMFFLLLLVGYYLVMAADLFPGNPGRRTKIVAEAVALGAIGMGLATLFVSYSRSAWLGTVAGSAVIVMLSRVGRRTATPDRRALVALGGVASLCVAVFVATNWSALAGRAGLTVQGTEIRSVEERVSLAGGALALIAQRPWLGVGLGNFSTALYRMARDSVSAYPIYQPVHNVLLLAAAELGVAGATVWAWLLLAPWIQLWVRRNDLRDTRGLALRLAGPSAALAALGIVSFFDYYVWTSHQGHLMMWLAWGLWAGVWTSAKSQDGVGYAA